MDYVSSTEGNYGTWQGLRSCAPGHYITGFRQRVLESQGTFGDDWGVDNVQAQCDDGTVLDGMDGVPPALQESPGRVRSASICSIRSLMLFVYEVYSLCQKYHKA